MNSGGGNFISGGGRQPFGRNSQCSTVLDYRRCIFVYNCQIFYFEKHFLSLERPFADRHIDESVFAFFLIEKSAKFHIGLQKNS